MLSGKQAGGVNQRYEAISRLLSEKINAFILKVLNGVSIYVVSILDLLMLFITLEIGGAGITDTLGQL